MILPGHGAETEVFLHGPAEKSASTVGNVCHAQTRDVLCLVTVDGATGQRDFTLAVHHSADCAQGGSLAGSVGAKQGGDACFLDLEVDAAKHLALPVRGSKTFDLEERAHRCSAPR